MKNNYYPNFKEFCKKAKKGNLIPIYKEILADLETPVTAFLKIDDGKYSFLLESITNNEKIATYSFLGTNPICIFKSKVNKIEIYKNNKKEILHGNPFHILKDLFSKYKFVPELNLPRFIGGAIGYIGYDSVRFFEQLPDNNTDDLNVPDLFFIFIDTLLIFEHMNNKIKIVSNAYIENQNLKEIYRNAILTINKIIKKINKPLKLKNKIKKSEKRIKVISNLNKKTYEKNVKKAKQYILEGDIIQVVLSQRFKIKIENDPFNIYRVLRVTNPSPYMFYLKFKDLKLIGSSPEIFARLEDGIVEERPIAGTRKRGKSDDEDIFLEKELLSDEKEKAEHIMLVDLGRNDIGRICKYGSVKVSDFMTIEKYSHVMHIVSDIKGKIKKNKCPFDVIEACFPAGTVSGAPKIRAMEIIDDLETTKRGPYAGAVAYFSYSSNFDSCIIIRTVLVIGKYAYVQAGAGIVADSIPENEYYETMNKAKAAILAIEMAEKGMLFN